MFHIVYFLNFDNVSLIEIKYNKTNTNKNVIMLINVSNQDRIRTCTPNLYGHHNASAGVRYRLISEQFISVYQFRHLTMCLSFQAVKLFPYSYLITQWSAYLHRLLTKTSVSEQNRTAFVVRAGFEPM